MSSTSIQYDSANCRQNTAGANHHGLKVLVVEHFLQSCDANFGTFDFFSSCILQLGNGGWVDLLLIYSLLLSPRQCPKWYMDILQSPSLLVWSP